MTAAHKAGDIEHNRVLSSTRRDQQDADQERLLLVSSEFSWSSPISPSEKHFRVKAKLTAWSWVSSSDLY